MAATQENTEISGSFSNLRINYENEEDAAPVNGNESCLDYGLPLPEVYKLAVSFYKGIYKFTKFIGEVLILLNKFMLYYRKRGKGCAF